MICSLPYCPKHRISVPLSEYSFQYTSLLGFPSWNQLSPAPDDSILTDPKMASAPLRRYPDRRRQ
jgi:hypothetical protein